MSISVKTHWLPSLSTPEEFAGGTAVIIDVLRASSTITQAVAAGAYCVVPYVEVAEARGFAEKLPNDRWVLGGERGGVKIDGFDFGNAPADYSAENVADKTVIITTTNGTKALHHAKLAKRIIIGSFVNLSAVAGYVIDKGLPIHLVCAGTNGALSSEDILFAGALCAEIAKSVGTDFLLEDDSSRMAFQLFERCEKESSVLNELRQSQGGRNLIALGYEADIAWVAEIDRYDVVPEYDHETGTITAAK